MSEPTTTIIAILEIDPNARVIVEDELVTWLDGNPLNITNDQIKEKKEELRVRAQIEKIKQEAEIRLLASDYWALQDTGAMSAEEKEYRKRLRQIRKDVDKESITLDEIAWPQLTGKMRPATRRDKTF